MSRMVSEFLASRVRRVSLPQVFQSVCVGRGGKVPLPLDPPILLTHTYCAA